MEAAASHYDDLQQKRFGLLEQRKEDEGKGEQEKEDKHVPDTVPFDFNDDSTTDAEADTPGLGGRQCFLFLPIPFFGQI